MENAIYDPRTARTVNGQVVRDPFERNIIPADLFDPVAVKIQSYFPQPLNNNLVNNFPLQAPYRQIQAIPSIKVDHVFTERARMSVYFSPMRTDKDNGNLGLPDPISERRDQFIRSHMTRINYDHTLTPTVLLHLGVGYARYWNPDTAPASITGFDAAKELGYRSGLDTGFPRMLGLTSSFGGMSNFGPTSRNILSSDKPTAVASATMTRGSHTLKFGGDWRVESYTNADSSLVQGISGFSSSQTGLPSTLGQNLQGGGVGFPYASFLLGLVNNTDLGGKSDPQYRRKTWAAFAQDTWKVTPKLTLDYGLRYDVQTPPQEIHNRTSTFSPTTPN
ncbi:MAG: TonB-dependent receptor domain-containing protein, partial [Pyrinomonadaceae bacterium]